MVMCCFTRKTNTENPPSEIEMIIVDTISPRVSRIHIFAQHVSMQIATGHPTSETMAAYPRIDDGGCIGLDDSPDIDYC